MRAKAFALAPGVHAVAIDGDVVLLNVTADAYFCLPDVGRDLVLDPGRGVLAIDAPELASELTAAGLVRPAPPDRPGAVSRLPTPPTDSALPRTCGVPRWRDLPEAALCLFDLWVHYRGRAFVDIVQLMAVGSGASPDAAPSAALLEVVRGFHRWVPYAPVSGKCLLRSFMLLRLLRRRGHNARWVFGVSTWPFQAHCWLQCGDIVLDDTFERLDPFHPLMVV